MLYLSIADVHAALAYYLDNRQEIDAATKQAATLVNEIQVGVSSKLQRHLLDGQSNG